MQFGIPAIRNYNKLINLRRNAFLKFPEGIVLQELRVESSSCSYPSQLCDQPMTLSLLLSSSRVK